ncbi:MAG: transglycosylase domain-containing protein, partial [Prevotella sp.]|nr:transglycosylase domain-containing protein [Prevotella sp.]
MRKKVIRILWKTLFSIIGVLFVIFVAIWNGWIGYMPDIEDLQNPISKYASQIYSADGKVLGTYNENRDNRIAVGYAKLSPYLVQALVATEDERFYEHSGIDFIALSRAILKRGIMQQHSAGGGSTITQQLAKQLYSEKAHSTLGRLLQKPIEWIIAVKLERNFTKEEIIAMYLNYFDYLHNAVGIKSAANTYFRKEPQDLTVTEAATLIGLCKNPSLYNPVRYPERCVERRNVVLSQMQKAGYMSSAECDKYSAEPLGLNFHRASNREQTAPYFREYLRQYMMAKKPDLANYPSWNKRQYHIDSIAWETDPLYGWCNKNLKKNGDPYDVNTDGLRIYTTIDTRMQKYAEEAVYEHMTKYLQPTFNNELRLRRNAPFSDNLTASQVTAIMNRSIRQSERYRVLKEAGYSEEDINKAFDTKVDMTVFSYKGEIDTMMTPRDSIKYYKKMLRAGFVSMDPMTGAVKAYVGGVNYNFFQYDMGMMGRRQVGSTIKPFLYSMAMQNGYSPCDVAPNVARTYIVAGKPWTP